MNKSIKTDLLIVKQEYCYECPYAKQTYSAYRCQRDDCGLAESAKNIINLLEKLNAKGLLDD